MYKFSNIREDDSVYSIVDGYGIVEEVIRNTVMTIKVKFENKSKWFFADGRHNIDDLLPTLFWNKVNTPDEENDKPPFRLKEWLKENLEQYISEFEYGKDNYRIFYDYARDSFYCISDTTEENAGCVYFQFPDNIKNYEQLLRLGVILRENNIDIKTLQKAYKYWA